MDQKSAKSTSEARDRKRARFEQESRSSKPLFRAVAIAGVIAAVLGMGYLLGRGTSGDATAPRVDPHGAGASAGSASAPATARSSAPGAAGAAGASRGPSGASAAQATAITAEGDIFRVPAGTGPSHVAFYKADVGGKSVPFFVARDASGTDHVAFDACQNCAAAKKGYVQQGDRMQCKNCGDTFPISNITKMGGQGGCHPISLPADASGGKVVVKASDLALGARYF